MQHDRRPEGTNLSNSRWANYRPDSSPFPPPELIQAPSLGALFFEMAAAHAHKLCYRTRNTELDVWERVTWREMEQQVLKTALYLRDNLGIKRGDRVGIMSGTRPEWLVADLAIVALGAVSTPIYQTQTAAESAYVLADAGVEVLLIENDEQHSKVRDLKKLRQLIAFENLSAVDARVISFQSILSGPAPSAEQLESIKVGAGDIQRSALASIVYTSGTTGMPKGVMQTHGNHIAMLDAGFAAGWIGSGDGVFLFLPLAHSFARIVGYTILATGGNLIFPTIVDRGASRFDAKRMFQDVKESAPKVFPSVPRLFEKVMTGIHGQSARGLRARLLRWALAEYRGLRDDKRRGMLKGLRRQLEHALADALVRKVRGAVFGANLTHCISGGAPISLDTLEFFDSLDVLVLEAYGLTETCPGISANVPAAYRFGTVGRAFEGVEMRIAADGEILARGPNISPGYWQKPEATAEAWDADGWFHTGDIGEVDEDGYLKITDRKKDLIVNAGGKNIAPQLIEGKIKSSPYISQVLVFGDRKPYLVALVTLETENVLRWAAAQKIPASDIAARPELRALLQKEIKSLTADLANYEQVQNFAILPEDFSIERGELTPSLKLKRKAIIEKHSALIEGLYQSSRES